MTKIEVQCVEKSKRGVFTFAAVNNPAMTFKSAGNGFLIGERYKLTILSSGAMEIEILPNSGDLKTGK